MAQHRLYGVFWQENGRPMWGMSRSRKRALRAARVQKALCVSMPLPSSNGPWDAPTFRHCADRQEGDYRASRS